MDGTGEPIGRVRQPHFGGLLRNAVRKLTDFEVFSQASSAISIHCQLDIEFSARMLSHLRRALRTNEDDSIGWPVVRKKGSLSALLSPPTLED